MRARRLRGVGLLLLVTLGFLFRLAPLGRYVTPDEPAWIERSIRFADALVTGDWASVPSTGHPGVTTMWLGAAGLLVRKLLSPAEAAAHLDWIRKLAWLAPENGEAFRHLSFFLSYGRVAVAAVNSLALLGVYGLVARLFDRSTAFLATGLLAFDPFLVGHAGLLHTDGLLATFSTLSVLSLLLAVREGPRAGAWAAVSGVTAGLAMLTKSLGGVLAIFAVAVLVSSWRLGKMRITRGLRLLVLWGFGGAGIYVALYPAMWGAPRQTLRDLLLAPLYQTTTALMPTFFAGRMALEHGPEFYAVALPFRLGPLVLIGLVVAVWVAVSRRVWSGELTWLGLFSLGYVLLLALSVKRYQRYLLPVVGPLSVVAAFSLAQVLRARDRPRALSAGALIALQLLLLLPFARYPLTDFNLLLGGPWIGPRLLSADWGEGMGAAARWLDQRPDADRLTAAASSVPSFASLFAGRAVPMEQAAQADYVVREIAQGPAAAPDLPVAHRSTVGLRVHAVVMTNTAPLEQSAFLTEHAGARDLIVLDARTPLVRHYDGPAEVLVAASFPDERALADRLVVEGRDRRSIWRVACPGASPITAEFLNRQLGEIATPVETTTVADAGITEFALHGVGSPSLVTPHEAVFGGGLKLVDGAGPSPVAWPADLSVVVRWQATSQPTADYRAAVTLRDSSGHAWTGVGSLVRNDVNFPTSAWAAREWADIDYELSLPPGVPPGDYVLEASLFDAATGAALGATGPQGDFRGTRVRFGSVRVEPASRAPEPGELAVSEELRITAGPLTLLGVDPPARRVFGGDPLSFSLAWQADADTVEDHQVRFRLAGAGDDVAFEVLRPLSPYPTSRWRAGDRYRSQYSPRIPADLSPGFYRLTVNVIDGQGRLLWEMSPTLARIEVVAQERSFTFPRAPRHHTDLAFGRQIQLVGYDLEPTVVRPGEAVALRLYWRADGDTDDSYTLFVHLRGPDGRLHGQVDRVPGDGQLPTNRWVEGQVIVDRIDLAVGADAPPGAYRVVIGFYDPAYGDRLPVADGSGDLLPGNEAVLPSTIQVSGE